MSIDLYCSPVVKNINARSLGDEDDKIIWADFKLDVSVDPAEVNQFMSDASQHLWYETMEKGKTERIPRMPQLNTLSVKGRWDNVNMVMVPDLSFFESGEIDDVPAVIAVTDRFEGGYIHKMKLDPMSNSGLLSFEYSVQIPGMKIGQLIDRVLAQSVGVHLYDAQQEMDL